MWGTSEVLGGYLHIGTKFRPIRSSYFGGPTVLVVRGLKGGSEDPITLRHSILENETRPNYGDGHFFIPSFNCASSTPYRSKPLTHVLCITYILFAHPQITSHTFI